MFREMEYVSAVYEERNFTRGYTEIAHIAALTQRHGQEKGEIRLPFLTALHYR